MRKVDKEITRNWIQEEHATLKEQTSTHIQMIVSVIEATKNLKEQLKKETKKQEQLYLGKTKKQEKLHKDCRGISENACGNEK